MGEVAFGVYYMQYAVFYIFIQKLRHLNRNGNIMLCLQQKRGPTQFAYITSVVRLEDHLR